MSLSPRLLGWTPLSVLNKSKSCQCRVSLYLREEPAGIDDIPLSGYEPRLTSKTSPLRQDSRNRPFPRFPQYSERPRQSAASDLLRHRSDLQKVMHLSVLRRHSHLDARKQGSVTIDDLPAFLTSPVGHKINASLARRK